jgi:hypothetical protein
MIPFEREIYTGLLIKYLEEEEERRKEEESKMRKSR